jgi:hypothetical protein
MSQPTPSFLLKSQVTYNEDLVFISCVDGLVPLYISRYSIGVHDLVSGVGIKWSVEESEFSVVGAFGSGR